MREGKERKEGRDHSMGGMDGERREGEREGMREGGGGGIEKGGRREEEVR